MKFTTLLSLCAAAHILFSANVSAATLLAGSGTFTLDNKTASINSFDPSLGELNTVQVSFDNISVTLDMTIDVDISGSGLWTPPTARNFDRHTLWFYTDFINSAGDSNEFDAQESVELPLSGLEHDDGDVETNLAFFNDGGPDEKFVSTTYNNDVFTLFPTSLPLGLNVVGPDFQTQAGINSFFTKDGLIEFKLDTVHFIDPDTSFGSTTFKKFTDFADDEGVEFIDITTTDIMMDFEVFYNFTPAAVPESETYALILGAAAMAFVWRRRRSAHQK